MGQGKRIGAILRDERGSVFLSGLVLVFIMTLVGAALFDLGMLENRLAVADLQSAQAFHIAGAGLDRAYLDIAKGSNSAYTPSTLISYTSVYTTPTLLNSGCASSAGAPVSPAGQPCFSNQSGATWMSARGTPSDGGSYTVTASAVVDFSNPANNHISLISIGCRPAGDPCPAGNAQAIVQAWVIRRASMTGITAAGDLTISGGGQVDSFNSTVRPYTAPPADCSSGCNALLSSNAENNGQIDLQGTIKGSIISTVSGTNTPAVTLGGGSLVTGNVTVGGTLSNSGAQVQGTVTTTAPTSPFSAPSVSPCGPFSSGVGLSGTYSYNASTGNLTVSGGKAVTLAANTQGNPYYCFNQVTLSGGSILQVSGAVLMYLNGKGSFSGGSLSNTTGKPINLQIVSSYSGSNGVVLSGGSGAYAAIYAPQADVVVSGGGNVYGGVVGRSFTMSGGSSRFHYDEALKDNTQLVKGIASYALSSWKQCKNLTCT